MPPVPLTITAPAHGGAVVAGAPVALRAEAVAPGGVVLQHRWWSTLPTDPPAPHPGDPPDLDLVAIATGLEASVRLSPGSHVLTVSSKDQVGDDVDSLRAVQHAGTTGGAPPDAPAPCVLHVAGAGVLLPADGRVSRALGVAALAPPLWPEPAYQALNALRYRWTFRPAAGADVVVEPPPQDLVFAPGTEEAQPFLPPPPLPPRVSSGPLTLPPGAYALTLRVTAGDAADEASRPVTVVA